MPKNVMVTLYYTQYENAVLDCKILNASFGAIQELGRFYSKTTGHYGAVFNEGKMEQVPLTHALRLPEEKIKDHVDRLHHNDDEADWDE